VAQKNIPDAVKTPLQFFRLLIDDEFLKVLLENTNTYLKTQKEDFLITKEMFLKHLAVWIVMGLCPQPKLHDFQRLCYR